MATSKKKLDLLSCDQACYSCIRGYKKKHDLKSGSEFKIRCSGIPEDYIEASLLENMGESEGQTALAMVDPVTWAKETLDWHCIDPDGEIWKRKNPEEWADWVDENPGVDIEGHSRYHRPYQATMLRCSSQNKVFRIGRQCLSGGTKILLSNGKTKKIEEVVEGDLVMSSSDNKMISSVVTGQWFAGRKKVYKIKTKFGHSIVCTDDHRFLIANKGVDRCNGRSIDDIPHEWLSMQTGLQEGSKIAVPLSVPHPETPGDVSLARLLGYFIADGSCSVKQSAKFTNTNMDYLLEFEDLAKQFGSEVKWYKKGNGYDLIISNGRGKSNPLRDLLKDLNLTNITGPEKLIPDSIFYSDSDTTREFLRTFWAADGYVSTFKRTGRKSSRTEIGNLQENLRLVEQIQEILWRFGVHGHIKKEGNAYRYVVSNKVSIGNFLRNVGPIPGKEEACAVAIENLSSIADSFVNVSDELLWDYVSSVEELGVQETWDIEVEGPQNFIANGILTHNSGKTECLVISMLFAMFTQPKTAEDEGFKIVVITPYQSQIDLIFTRLMELIRSSPTLTNSIHRSVKAPIYQIKLRNKSVVSGFTAGTKSGGNAGSVRGQTAAMLVFDEADYLCLLENSLVEKEDGSLVEIKDVLTGDSLHSFENGSTVSKVTSVVPTMKSSVTRVHTSYSEIESTPEHRHFVLGERGVEERSTENLTTKDYVLLPKVGILGKKKVPIGLAELAGYYWGDGNKKAGHYKEKKYWSEMVFTDKDKKNLEYHKECAQVLGFSNSGPIRKATDSQAYSLTLSDKSFVGRFKDDFNSLYYSKELTSEISTLEKRSLCGFLRGAFDAEGSVNPERRSVVISQGSKQAIQIIRLLLHKLGILSSLSEHPPSGFGKSPVYQLSIAEDRFLYLFSELIGFNCVAKAEKLALCVSERRDLGNSYSNLKYPSLYCRQVFREILESIKFKFSGKQIVFDSLKRSVDPTLNSLEALNRGLLEIKELSLAGKVEELYSRFYASKINSLTEQVSSNGFKTVDISVPATKNFFANGMLTHNCDEDMDAAMSITTNFPNATVWMSSTPSGKRERFYKTCLNNKGYQEFHYPSSANPLFNERMDEQFREVLTEIGYVHEILADFGEQEVGVFQNSYTKAAQKDYKYGDLSYNPRWTYSIGVDWNDTANGTNIVVLGFDPDRNVFTMVDQKKVSRDGWTQLLACEKIVEMNRLWHPFAIYLDSGHGGTQFEVLKKFGYSALQNQDLDKKHPDRQLVRILKMYQFGSKIEVRDPFTGEPINKPAKPFLVEQLVRRFESQDIEISSLDQDLIDQLAGYIIERVSTAGVPVYGTSDKKAGDHILDALMLANVAFPLELGPLGKPKLTAEVKFSGQFGEAVESSSKSPTPVPTPTGPKRSPQEKCRPQKQRTQIFEQRTLTRKETLPGSNTTTETSLSLWAWDEFMYSDKPAPRARSLSDFVSTPSPGRRGRGRGRPSRSNF